MRLLKPAWVSHDGKPIFSVDIHPDCTRFATGGQGEDSGKVVIWNMAPVMNEEDELNESIPKLLCQMDNHLACVNCVRWSASGKYLASGGDDRMIMIWQLARSQGPSTIFGSEANKVIMEQWRCVYILRGHTEDVLDLNWSPDDAYLATCSVDNSVIIWNSARFPEVTAVLRDHVGMVKGVTWDPVGKYIATQADDKTLKVWRTSDWQVEAELMEPFQDCGGTTHVLRLSWSPDGHYIVSAHAMNNSGPVAKILERDGWKCKMDFAGHRKAINVVRFNPRLFVKPSAKDPSKNKQHSCCAIGSKDRSVSIWLTSLRRPLVVTHDLFNHSIMDVSWSVLGYHLLVCSKDGTVAYIDFTEEELGKALTQEEKERFHKQIYGTSISSSKVNLANTLIENPELLRIQQQHQMKRATTNLSKTTAPPPPLISSDKQMKTPERSGSTSSVDMKATPTKSGLHPGSSHFTSADAQSPQSKMDTLSKQKETRTKDGRRRITPFLLAAQEELTDGPSALSMSSPQPVPIATRAESTPTISTAAPSAQNISALNARLGEHSTTGFTSIQVKMEPSSTATTTPTSSTTTATSVQVKRKANGPILAWKRGRKEKDKTSKVTGTQTAVSKDKDKQDHDDLVDYCASSAPVLALPYPAPEAKLSLQIGGSGGDPAILLELENNLSASGSSGIHVIKCQKGGMPSWESCMSSAGIALAGSRQVVCVACQDKMVWVFSQSGRKLFPGLLLSSAVSILQCSGYFVLVVTSNGGVYVWDTKRGTAIVKNESVLPILKGPDITITRSSLTDQGFPIISLSSHSTYTFNASLGAWVLLSSTDDSLQANSNFQSCLQHQVTPSMGPLASIQGQSSRFGRQTGRIIRANTAKQQAATLSYLENQISSSVVLSSDREYHFWLLTYVRYLVQEGLELRLREVCEDLLGPTFRSNSREKDSTWEPCVLGFLKRELLRDVLPIIGSSLSLQRVFTEYKEQLDTVEF